MTIPCLTCRAELDDSLMKPEMRDNARLQKRFIREAVLSRKVRQENVAAVADARRLPAGVLFMVADFIEGTVRSLRGLCLVGYFTLMRPKNNKALTWERGRRRS